MAKTISDVALDLGVFALDRELENETDGSGALRQSRVNQRPGTPLRFISSTPIYVARLSKAKSAGSVKSGSELRTQNR